MLHLWNNMVSFKSFFTKKMVRAKPRESHSHKPQPFPDTKRKRKQTKPNKRKSNKGTKSTKINSLFPKQGNRNAKRTEKHKNKRKTTNFNFVCWKQDIFICIVLGRQLDGDRKPSLLTTKRQLTHLTVLLFPLWHQSEWWIFKAFYCN